ncbi:beta-1,4-glucosyltransferase [Rhodoferax sp. OV413]|uniref:WecB/TagA/CpsF family glycosyltransferase n=1 Tax=Rhodoferax sp. OV413 TaxID=1855285 RepID=UPI000885190C|nr:WecB/TagA/CpsF family glycosyltransferase [Rhodoferax sp. OV413]SDP79386.1 beta-1,4-glucosyltransferase [Rhodoferax sp. OV413]
MQHNTHIELLPLAGYPIRSTTSSVLAAMLQTRLNKHKKSVLLFANTNFVLKCQPLQPWLKGEEVILVNDGIGLDIACKLVHGQRFRDNLNGTDFLPYLFKNLAAPYKIFLLGGKPGVAEKAISAIEQNSNKQVVGCLDGYSKLSPAEQCARINQSGADIVLVAMGNPLQEEWIRANMASLDAQLFVGVGALFDFLSGGVQRAPRWVQQIRCEWLFRLLQEPTRLMRRYTIDIARFLFVCLRYGNKQKHSV